MQCLTFLRLFDSLTTFIYYNIYGECFRWLQQFSLHHINTSLGFQTEGGWGGVGQLLPWEWQAQVKGLPVVPRRQNQTVGLWLLTLFALFHRFLCVWFFFSVAVKPNFCLKNWRSETKTQLFWVQFLFFLDYLEKKTLCAFEQGQSWCWSGPVLKSQGLNESVEKWKCDT